MPVTGTLVTKTHGPLGHPFHAEMAARQRAANLRGERTKFREALEANRSGGMRETVERMRCDAPPLHLDKKWGH